MKKLLFLTILLTVLSCSKQNGTSISSSNVEPCDCVKMFDDYGQMGRLSWDWDFAKECTKKYGNNDKMTMEMLNGPIDVAQFKTIAGPVFQNATKDCNDNRKFTKEEEAKACDCYQVSVSVAGAYDNLTQSQKTLRSNCLETFGNFEDSRLKELCEKSK